MAKNAHSIPLPIAPPSRRTLFSGTAAIIMGSGITAGAAASIADLVEPPPSLDATLIALCRAYVDHGRQFYAICAEQDAMADKQSAAGHAEWNRLDDLAGEHSVQMIDLEDEIPKLRALTPEGRRAKAEALLLLMRDISSQHGGDFARSLARDLVGRA